MIRLDIHDDLHEECRAPFWMAATPGKGSAVRLDVLLVLADEKAIIGVCIDASVDTG